MTAPPVLETERLVLRPHGAGDFDAMAAMWADSEIVRHIGGQPASRAEAWSRLLRYAGLWPLLGYGYWAIEERDTGRYAGDVGFADFQREIEPPVAGMPEIGWALASHAHGRGLATEAVRAAVAWGEEAFPEGRRTCCLIDPDNLASIRVAEKCGYEFFAEAEYRGGTSLIYRR